MTWSNAGWRSSAGWYKNAVGGAIPFDLDTNANAVATQNTSAGTSVSIGPFSTDKANCRVYVAMACNGGAPVTPTASGVTFFLRASHLNGATTIALYEGLAASPLSGVTIIAGQATSDFMTATAFAFSGGKTSSPYDANGPASGLNGGTGAFTTANANDIIVAAGVTNVAIDSLFIPISPASTANFLSCGYQIVSSTQPTGAVFGGNSTGINVAVDAIVKGP